jgi:hypothetical protein
MDINVKISGLDDVVEAISNLAQAIEAAAANSNRAADEAISKAKDSAKKTASTQSTAAKPAATSGKKSTAGASAPSQEGGLAPEELADEDTDDETADEQEDSSDNHPSLEELQAAAAKAAKIDREATKKAVSKYAEKLSEVAEEDRAALIVALGKI